MWFGQESSSTAPSSGPSNVCTRSPKAESIRSKVYRTKGWWREHNARKVSEVEPPTGIRVSFSKNDWRGSLCGLPRGGLWMVNFVQRKQQQLYLGYRGEARILCSTAGVRAVVAVTNWNARCLDCNVGLRGLNQILRRRWYNFSGLLHPVKTAVDYQIPLSSNSWSLPLFRWLPLIATIRKTDCWPGLSAILWQVF